MKATMMTISNIEEIETARKCGMDVPEPVFTEFEEIFFLVDAAESVHRDEAGNIILQLNGILYVLKYEKVIYNELKMILE